MTARAILQSLAHHKTPAPRVCRPLAGVGAGPTPCYAPSLPRHYGWQREAWQPSINRTSTVPGRTPSFPDVRSTLPGSPQCTMARPSTQPNVLVAFHCVQSSADLTSGDSNEPPWKSRRLFYSKAFRHLQTKARVTNLMPTWQCTRCFGLSQCHHVTKASCFSI